MRSNTYADYSNNKAHDINSSQKRQRLDNHSSQNNNDNNNSERKTLPCYICGRLGHPTKKCNLKGHPDRNQEYGVPFKDSSKGKLWKANENGGPHGILNSSLKLDGSPFQRARDNNPQRREEGKSSITFLANIDTNTYSHIKHPDFLTVVITLLNPKAIARKEGTIRVEELEEDVVVEEGTKAEAGVTRLRAEEDSKAEAEVITPTMALVSKEVTALLDTGCLVGDCISEESINSLNTSNYLFDTNTTICSGFDNTCETKFKSLNLNISFIDEINLFEESFNTTVTV